tara:strand:+ start:10904 stop:12403 length:1500 start_codon:yes stop_codon:yes gene_type:complete
MRVYDQEVRDGIGDLVKSNNTIACCAVAETNATPSAEDIEKLQRMIASAKEGEDLATAENKNQIDLYYIKSILVSTGWNKNDDVFDPKELWEARNTPEDKPFNFMHDEKDIIGHITANEVVNFDGQPIAEEDSEVPSQFNILTSAVVYTEWSDPEQRERMHKIVSEIEDGKWFVSMECLFPEFDYALAKENGETKVIKRNQASAFLTKHLRSYGGDGKYEDYRVGRLLRNLSFSGKGLVSKPANPRSVILEGNDFFDESQAQVLTISSLKEKDMSDNYEKQVHDLRAELAESKAANEALKEKVIAEQQAEFETQIEALQATIAEQAEKIAQQEEAAKSLAETITAKEEALVEAAAATKEKEEELAVMKKKEAMMKRKAQLEEAGFDAEEAVATVEDFNHLDDETFDKIVAAMKKKAQFPPKKDEEEEKEEKEEKAVMKKKAELEEEVDSAEASEEVLDTAEEPTEVAVAEAMGEDDPAESLRTVASEWLGSVLQTNKKS